MQDSNEFDNLPAVAVVAGSIYNSLQTFQDGQRMAQALAASSLVPQDYRNNVANTLVALEMAQRTGSSPMAVMQNMHVIHGRPSWSAQFVIAALNSCGRFGPLRFRVTGSGDDETCVAWAIDRSTGDELEGPPVSIGMAKKEGWYSKAGSKWQTMPQLMLRYRSAKFFGNLYAPDVLMGMHTADEVEDIGPTPTRTARASSVVDFDTDTGEVLVHTARPRTFVQPGDIQPVTIEPHPEVTATPVTSGKRARKTAPPPEEAVPDLPPAPPADTDDWGFGS
jgi:hypothetical protein